MQFFSLYCAVFLITLSSGILSLYSNFCNVFSFCEDLFLSMKVETVKGPNGLAVLLVLRSCLSMKVETVKGP